jgi:beta-carotene hydroxylase
MVELKTALTVPRVAWPTCILAVVALSCFVAGVSLAATANWAVALVLMTLSAYLSFTPMHDAAHRGTGTSSLINEVVGRLCIVPLLGPFPAFRYVHLEHHKHTNDAEKDPDFWSGLRPAWALPLRWVTQDLHYYAVYLRAGRKPAEIVEVVGTLAVMAGICIALTLTGHGLIALFWVLGSRLALMALAYSFDYLPHRPHLVKGKDNRFLATAVRPNRFLQVLLLNQNLHLMHHLHPAVPFYRYGFLWRAQESQLRAQGVVVKGEPSQSRPLHQE